jgi:hypothetical protein
MIGMGIASLKENEKFDIWTALFSKLNLNPYPKVPTYFPQTYKIHI